MFANDFDHEAIQIDEMDEQFENAWDSIRPDCEPRSSLTLSRFPQQEKHFSQMIFIDEGTRNNEKDGQLDGSITASR
jgi:hypothetical protein